MRLLIRLGYQNFLFGKGANVSELIFALDNMQIVSERGYGNEKRYILSEEELHPEVILIPDESISLPETKNDLIERYHSIAAERDLLKAEVYSLKKQIEEIKKVTEHQKT